MISICNYDVQAYIRAYAVIILVDFSLIAVFVFQKRSETTSKNHHRCCNLKNCLHAMFSIIKCKQLKSSGNVYFRHKNTRISSWIVEFSVSEDLAVVAFAASFDQVFDQLREVAFEHLHLYCARFPTPESEQLEGVCD